LIQPGFHINKIHALYEIIQKTVNDFLVKFPTGKNIDVYPLMHKLAFEIVINALFTADVPPENQHDLNEFINEVQAFVIKDLRQPHKSWWFSLSGEVKRNLKRAEAARSIIRTMIHERRQNTHSFNDLLDMLLNVRYEDTGESMNEDQVIDEILILLIAGHETTANALSWTLYLLANHPDQLERLKQSTKGIGLQECVSNDALTAVISEGMRLYPPAWISDRMALEDDTYGEFSLPKGIVIITFYYGLHRDEKYWENATAFKPERFMQKTTDKDKPKAFYPFGAGPRLCIGNNFAMAEMAIFLQTMIHSFTLKPTEIVPKINPLVTLRPDRVVLDIEWV
jgi:cytochrome P450